MTQKRVYGLENRRSVVGNGGRVRRDETRPQTRLRLVEGGPIKVKWYRSSSDLETSTRTKGQEAGYQDVPVSHLPVTNLKLKPVGRKVEQV